jgi:hypothetical protein
MQKRSRQAAITIAAITVVQLFISGIPRFKNATHGSNYLIGEITWVGFLAGTALLAVIAVVALVHRFRRVDTTS